MTIKLRRRRKESDLKPMCACGLPLHFTNKVNERNVQVLVRELGECVKMETPKGAFMVPRTYLALHGIKAADLPSLAQRYGFQKVQS